MSITDELREWGYGFCGDTHDVVTAIADRIDAEHQKALDERKAKNGDMWLKGYAVCHEELMEGHPVIVADLEKAGWVKLPKDADGEYIHFGDVLDQFGTPMTVFAMSDPDPDQGDCMLELITDGISDGTWVRARKMRHYHAPTVEDVLREFFSRYVTTKPKDEDDAIIAEYAAKLRLAGDAE